MGGGVGWGGVWGGVGGGERVRVVCVYTYTHIYLCLLMYLSFHLCIYLFTPLSASGGQ